MKKLRAMALERQIWDARKADLGSLVVSLVNTGSQFYAEIRCPLGEHN